MFVAPGSSSSSGDRVKMEDLVGRLLLIEPTEHKTGIETTFGLKDAIACTIVDLDEQKEYTDQLVFGQQLIGSLKGSIGKKVLGRLYLGEAKKGQKPPYKLADATTDPTAVEKATAYLAGGLSSPAPATPAPAATTAGIDPQILALLQQQMGAKQVS